MLQYKTNQYFGKYYHSMYLEFLKINNKLTKIYIINWQPDSSHLLKTETETFLKNPFFTIPCHNRTSKFLKTGKYNHLILVAGQFEIYHHEIHEDLWVHWHYLLQKIQILHNNIVLKNRIPVYKNHRRN